MRTKVWKRPGVARFLAAMARYSRYVAFRAQCPLLSAQNPLRDHAAYLEQLDFVDGKQEDGNSGRVRPLIGRQSCKPALSTA